MSLLIILLVIWAIMSWKEQKKTNKATRQMQRTGELDPFSPYGMEYFQKMKLAVINGDYSMFPEKLRESIRSSGCELFYIQAMIEEKEMKDGFQPCPVWGNYDKRTYDPYKLMFDAYPAGLPFSRSDVVNPLLDGSYVVK